MTYAGLSVDNGVPVSAIKRQVGRRALLTNDIAPGKRTLAPSRCAVNASRMDAMAAATTCLFRYEA